MVLDEKLRCQSQSIVLCDPWMFALKPITIQPVAKLVNSDCQRIYSAQWDVAAGGVQKSARSVVDHQVSLVCMVKGLWARY